MKNYEAAFIRKLLGAEIGRLTRKLGRLDPLDIDKRIDTECGIEFAAAVLESFEKEVNRNEKN